MWEPYGGAGTGGDVFILLAGLAARVIGTCAVFYTLFLCRMLGAGDIKLMALCTGLLGMGPGLLVIFTGLFLAALRAAGMIWQQGSAVDADGADRNLYHPLRKGGEAPGISGKGG